MVCILSIVYGPKWPYYSCDWIYWIILHCLGQDMQVLYLGRALRTKETLPDFLKWRRVTRHPLVFRGLTGSQQTPGVWGVTVFFRKNAKKITNFSVIFSFIIDFIGHNMPHKHVLYMRDKISEKSVFSNFSSKNRRFHRFFTDFFTSDYLLLKVFLWKTDFSTIFRPKNPIFLSFTASGI